MAQITEADFGNIRANLIKMGSPKIAKMNAHYFH